MPQANHSSGRVSERVIQIHHAYLNCVYAYEYYKRIYFNTVRYTRHFDFIIGLGAAVSGGTGVVGVVQQSILGAWACGALTLGTIVLTAAKASYNWPAQVEAALRNSEFFDVASRAYRSLIDDMNYRRRWNPEFDARYHTLREELRKSPQDTLRPLATETQREIQNGIKRRIRYKNWWKPRD